MNPEVSKYFDERTEEIRQWETDFTLSPPQRFQSPFHNIRVYENGRVELRRGQYGNYGAPWNRRNIRAQFGIEIELMKNIRVKLGLPDGTPIRKTWLEGWYADFLLDFRHGMVLSMPHWRQGSPIQYVSENARPMGGSKIHVISPDRAEEKRLKRQYLQLAEAAKAYFTVADPKHRYRRADADKIELVGAIAAARAIGEICVPEDPDALDRFYFDLDTDVRQRDCSLFRRQTGVHHHMDYLKILEEK